MQCAVSAQTVREELAVIEQVLTPGLRQGEVSVQKPIFQARGDNTCFASG